MRPFLYGLTFSLGLCLLVPAAAHGRGALGGSEAPPERSRAETQAEKNADQRSVYLIGCIAALVAVVVVVQFVREVRGSAPPPRVMMYSARADSFDGTSTHHGLAEAEDGDDYDDYRDATDF